MRHIEAHAVTEAVKAAVIEANYELGEDVIQAFEKARTEEASPVGREIIERLIENARIARTERIPICQDTGLVVVFADIGQDMVVSHGGFADAVAQGVREGYEEGYLRKSVCHPFSRKNTGDNTPVIIHANLVKGSALRLWVVPKGGGSENMSRLYMLPPSAGWTGVKEKIVQTVEEAGPNPCPPTIVGVGIGGNFEQSAIMAKRSLLRPLGKLNPEADLAAMEQEVLEAINRTGVGPQGLGGRITSLAVHILMMPCHIASLPLAINVQCHASRHIEINL